jgi:formylglycine-generating enzyme required for sulfatase activity
MKNTKTTFTFGLFVSFLLIAFSSAGVSAQALHVDSVSVDSVWTSDTAGIQSRSCIISFIPQGSGTAIMTLSMSSDSGKTFTGPAPTDSLKVLGYTLYVPLATGQKAHITARVLGGDRPGVSFKMTATQNAPVIAGSPQTIVLGPTVALTPGSSVAPAFGIRFAGDSTSYGYGAIAKVYWNLISNGTIVKTDSTAGANALTWTWQTTVPAGSTVQTGTVIAYAVDNNGLTSAPETLSVQFGLHRQVVMKTIPSGTFQMGEAGVADAVHQVTLSAAFSMQETPVTQEQYLAVRGANPSYSVGDLTRPVENVSWYDAVLFCNGLSKLSGLDTCYTFTADGATDAVCDFSKKGYRLPTEAEWERACRGGTTTTYWWGPDSNGLGASVYIPQYGALSTTTSVATLAANPYGLYDIDGNGWKWCNDWFSQPYASGSVTDPKGPATGVNRAQRGGTYPGSFFVLQDFYRSANRTSLNPSTVNSYSGFTCARSQ